MQDADDVEALAAAVPHDAAEDARITAEEIEAEFGSRINLCQNRRNHQ